MESGVSRISEARLRLPEPVMRTLQAVARTTGLTASQVVESLLFEFLHTTSAEPARAELPPAPAVARRRATQTHGVVLPFAPPRPQAPPVEGDARRARTDVGALRRRSAASRGAAACVRQRRGRARRRPARLAP
jgi:hypothetical protein